MARKRLRNNMKRALARRARGSKKSNKKLAGILERREESE